MDLHPDDDSPISSHRTDAAPTELKPALLPEEWHAAYEPELDASLGFEAVHSELVQAADHGHWLKAVALANAALHPADRRKLSGAHVRMLRDEASHAASAGRQQAAANLRSLAAVLTALLPPWELTAAD